MCGLTETPALAATGKGVRGDAPPVETVLKPPSILARYTCASILVAFFAVFFSQAFVSDESRSPGVGVEMHSYKVPLFFTVGYLVSLPLLKLFSDTYLRDSVDTKVLLKETMVIYNAGQVILNAWMVYRFAQAVMFRGHPVVGDLYNVTSGATYTVWVHYCDKYLEFFDTYFMILRGRMDQVSFLHIYHHTSIAWAWWAAMVLWPGGDAYFGALLNSLIHVLMYSYYTLSLLKISCPWKRYLTQAQLAQFVSVIIFTGVSMHKLAGEAQWRHCMAWTIQFLEMSSMVVLFTHFYRKAYRNKKRKEIEKSERASSDSVSAQTSVSSVGTDEAQD